MSYTIEHIARIIGTVATNNPGTVIDQLLIDSRKLYSPATSLFFAIQGPRRDGHQFIEELYERGVRNFVVSQSNKQEKFREANFLLVHDVLAALQQLAAFHRQQYKIPVIGITGSNGKTIVKEWLYQLLQEDFNIVRSPKSYNSQIGVPLSVWQMNATHDLAIFEAGISQPGEMEKLEAIIQPTIGVLTTIGEAHSKGFTSATEKTGEKVNLFKNCPSVIYSRDNIPTDTDVEHLHIQQWGRDDISFYHWSQKGPAWLEITKVEKSLEASIIHAKYFEKEIAIEIPFTDEASIENAISCLAVMLVMNTGHDKIVKRMKMLQPVNMRLELKKGIHGCSIINDSYSADLSSLAIAMNFLSQQNSTRKTVILSDFLESGLSNELLYAEIGNLLLRHQIHSVIGIGEHIQKFLPVALRGNVVQQQYYINTESFIQHYRFSQLKEETILVKGARAFEFEKIIQVLEQKAHETVLEINLNAVIHNLKSYQKTLRPSTKIMAMVKAFAYGSGGAEIAGILQYHKVDYLGVAYADEGVELRKAGISLPIMVMNAQESAFNNIVENNLEPELYSFELLASFDKFLQQEGLSQYPVHIEIETGMNRLGFAVDDIDKLIATLKTTSSFQVRSVFSHLAASEEEAQDDFTRQQSDLFEKATAQLQNGLNYPFLKHIANSAAAIRHPDLQLDMVRLGIGLYGVDPSGSGRSDLQTVATLKSTIAQIKKLHKGDSVSYNRKGRVEKDSLIATIRIGYADGFPRRLGNGVGKVLIGGQLAPVIGAVCMDMFMADITHIASVQEGDDVTIFGESLPVQQVAAWAATIPYEIMTGISQRVKRVYFEE